MLIQEFFSDDGTLKAEIYTVGYDYKLMFYNNGKLVDIRSIRHKSIDQVSAMCENFVQRIMSL